MWTDTRTMPAGLSRRAGLRRLAAAAAPLLVGLPRAVLARGDGAPSSCLFGVPPYLPPLSLDRVFAPVVVALGRVLGQDVHLRTKPGFEAFAAALTAGAYDLALVHPFLYLAAASHGYVPLARVDEPLRAVFLARAADNDLGDLGDLVGRELALPPALSAASEMAEDALAAAGLRPGVEVRVRYHESKAACLQAVTLGQAAACVMPRFALAQLGVETGGAVRIFHERSLDVGLAVVALGRMPEPERERVRDLLVGWSGTPEGRRLLAGAGWPGLVPAVDGDFDTVRAATAARARGPAGRS